MNLQIIEEESQSISGFETVILNKENRGLNLSHIPDNSCDLIIARNSLDNTENPKETLSNICSKIRSNGSIVVSGVESRCFFKNAINGMMSEDSISYIISKNLSISTIDTVKNYLKELGLTVKSSTINGVLYEITAGRNP